MAKERIYQLMVRHFGNCNPTRKHSGTIEENGCGKFADISAKALSEIRSMGFTHVWLTGVLEHSTGTSFPHAPADDSVLLKGIAGSPYAVRDYFDVSAELAQEPAYRLKEFKELMDRCKSASLKVIIDFVPNHVARSYASDVRPQLSFGKGDDEHAFFAQNNNFYYLTDGAGPMTLPGGVYEQERQCGKVTGNNAATWRPSLNDWYETIKLNYGHDYTHGGDTSHLGRFGGNNVPDTWLKMDAVLAYWQQFGVKGFRADMAHMVPVQFWSWAIERARARDTEVYFTAEAYDGDPAKLSHGNILHELLASGFDSVYDGDTYELIKEIYEGQKWANDIDEVLWDEQKLHSMLRYVENHDEVRVASRLHWGAHGSMVGRSVAAVSYGLGRGPVMMYNGQEVGEPAEGSEGFAGDDGRTSIFDYWSCPELAKWVNGGKFDGGKLSDEQKQLREWYAWWLGLMGEPAFVRGDVYGLNYFNRDNTNFGRVGDETVSGHWLYAYVRYTDEQAYLVVVNLHPTETLHGVEVELPEDLLIQVDKLESEYRFQAIAPCDAAVVLIGD